MEDLGLALGLAERRLALRLGWDLGLVHGS